jgi:hypothetical protein
MKVNQGGRLAELIRERLCVSWPVKIAVSERVSGHDETVFSYMSELAEGDTAIFQ